MPSLHPWPLSAPADAGGGSRSDAAGADGASEPIDAESLARLRQLDPDGQRGFVRQVLQAYARSLERHLAALADAALAADLHRAGEQAHALKSSSASIGALALSTLCAEVERRARAGDAAVLAAPLRALGDEGARVRDAVQAMLRG